MSRWAPLLVLQLLLCAGCGDASPEADMPPLDLGPPGERDLTVDAANVYEGTCLEPLVTCFDFGPPCTQVPTQGGFMSTAENGATYAIDFAMGTQEATGSDGTRCWSASTDPATDEIVYEAPSGTYRERVDASGRTIACPDGSQDRAPAGDAPWIIAQNQCDLEP